MAWVVKNKKTGAYRLHTGTDTRRLEWAGLFTDEEKEEGIILLNPETHNLIEIEIKEKG